MTQTSERPGLPGPVAGPVAHHGADLAPDLEADLEALRVALAAHPFPTHQDDLLAVLIARHEPVRLAWRLSTLSRTRTYHSVAELIEDLRHGAGAA
ncbi:hypothetical protein [Oryzobacter terrae]|uniref:hypothetical protein n=1 Tax=Oryzobacter terrae TaxID=1620385 RepID=UPI00366F484A